jgi:CRISPR-associated protein Cas2
MATASTGNTPSSSAIDRVRMQSQLEEHMNLKEDQCVIVDLGPNEEEARAAATVLGPSLPKGETGVVVV